MSLYRLDSGVCGLVLPSMRSCLPSPTCMETQVSNSASHAWTCLISETWYVPEVWCVRVSFAPFQSLYIVFSCVCSLPLTVSSTLKHKLKDTVVLWGLRKYCVFFVRLRSCQVRISRPRDAAFCLQLKMFHAPTPTVAALLFLWLFSTPCGVLFCCGHARR